MARSKLTPERSETILGLVRSGNYLQVAAAYAGIDPTTLSRWLAKGRLEIAEGRRTAAAEFAESCARAEAQAEAVRLQRIAKAAETDWKADAWYLERRFPTRWGDRRTIDVTASVDVRLEQAFVLSPDSAVLAEELLAHLGGMVVEAGRDADTVLVSQPGVAEHPSTDSETDEAPRVVRGHRTGLAEVPQPVRTRTVELTGHGRNGSG